MLFGEHAVLKNHPALCMAINQRLKLILEPRLDNLLNIKSNLGELNLDILKIQNSLPIQPFSYLIKAFQTYQKVYPDLFNTGFDLTISSDFSSTIGFGSSSALIISLISALEIYIDSDFVSPLAGETGPKMKLRDREGANLFQKIFQISKKLLLDIQGQGSGTDLATALYGGIVFYQAEPLLIQKLELKNLNNLTHLFTAIYSGKKTPTSTVISLIQNAYKNNPDLYKTYFQKIHEITLQAKQAILNNNLNLLGALMNTQHMLMEAMNLSTPAIQTLIHACQSEQLLGAKISGSGLGDCIITLGKLKPHTFPQNPAQKAMGILQIPLEISDQGLLWEVQDFVFPPVGETDPQGQRGGLF